MELPQPPAIILSLSIILLAVLLAPIFSRRVRVPVVVTEMVIGIVIGRSFLNLIPADPWLEFFSYFGLIYLLFLAGLEIEFEGIRRRFTPVACVALASFSIPFLLGFIAGSFVGIHPLFLGTILSTTSIGVVLPLSRELRCGETFTHVLLGSTVLIDLFSVFLLAVSIELILGKLTYLFAYSIVFIAVLFALPILSSAAGFGERIRSYHSGHPHFYFEVRFCFALIAGLALLAEVIGFHAILGAFIAGLVVSEITLRGGELEQNLMSFGYGFFIPLFFIMVGVNTNLPNLLSSIENLAVFALILAIGIFGKVFGVTAVSRLFKLTLREGFSLGFIESARLSLILAGAEIGRSLGIISEAIYSTFVVFSLISVLVGPSVGRALLRGEV